MANQTPVVLVEHIDPFFGPVLLISLHKDVSVSIWQLPEHQGINYFIRLDY
jgi:hypothetical protein